MKNTDGVFLVAALLILACGIVFASLNIRDGLTDFRSYDRYVSVKGLATKDVTADLALWPISYTETGNDLIALQTVAESRGAAILAFLEKQGIKGAEVELQQVNVQDLLAQSYRQEGAEASRYILTQTYLVRTGNIEAVSKAARNIGELVKQGIVLAQTGGPTYLFTKLNDVKPGMIADATKNARDAAAQFAADSGQDVADIRTASQGMFQILPRDDTYAIPEAQQKDKTVRVVSTVEFYLD